MGMNQKPLVDKTCVLEKFDMKGGWTFARIPEIPQDRKAWFGWVKVSGKIDDYEIINQSLMPMGNGTLFLSVKAEIRKKIKKEVGDIVHIILYANQNTHSIDQDLQDCLEEEPKALSFYKHLDISDQKAFQDWIAASKSEQIKEERIAKSIDLMLDNKTLNMK